MFAAQLRAPLYEDKVVDFLFSKAEISDRKATREQLEADLESEEGHVHGPGCGHDHSKEVPAQVLNDVMTVARAGASLGIPGLYVTGDPGGVDEDAKIGSLKVRLGLGWAKSHAFTTGQCPVMRYNRQLMQAILHDKAHIADAVNATVIPLDKAPDGYRDFDRGAARKYIIDPHSLIATLRGTLSGRARTWGLHRPQVFPYADAVLWGRPAAVIRS